jgi:hypothetical protein
MTTVNIKGLHLLFESKDGFITLTNDQLGIKYMARYDMKEDADHVVVGADFSDETCKYITLQINMRGEVVDFDLLSDIMYEVRLGPYITSERDHLIKIAELKSELLRMKIGHHYYQLSTEKRITALENALQQNDLFFMIRLIYSYCIICPTKIWTMRLYIAVMGAHATKLLFSLQKALKCLR